MHADWLTFIISKSTHILQTVRLDNARYPSQVMKNYKRCSTNLVQIRNHLGAKILKCVAANRELEGKAYQMLLFWKRRDASAAFINVNRADLAE